VSWRRWYPRDRLPALRAARRQGARLGDNAFCGPRTAGRVFRRRNLGGHSPGPARPTPDSTRISTAACACSWPATRPTSTGTRIRATPTCPAIPRRWPLDDLAMVQSPEPTATTSTTRASGTVIPPGHDLDGPSTAAPASTRIPQPGRRLRSQLAASGPTSSYGYSPLHRAPPPVTNPRGWASRRAEVAEPERVGQPGDRGPLLEAPTAAVLVSARTWWPSPSTSASWWPRPARPARRR